MKLKTILFSFILGLTVSGAVTSTPENSSQDSVDDSCRLFISEEMNTTENGSNICPLSDLDVYKSE